MDALDEPPPRANAFSPSTDFASDCADARCCGYSNGPCKLDGSPQPALAFDTNIVTRIPALRVIVIAREIVFMKFLFLPRGESRVQSPKRNPRGKTGTGQKHFSIRAEISG
jgi:hypothetical protein